MKSPIKNKSELIEIRLCYVLSTLFITLLFIYGIKRFVLLLNIVFIPFLRIISLYCFLPKPTKFITKTIQSLLILFPIFFYAYIEIWIEMYTSKNELIKLFWMEIFILVLFHRYIFLSKNTLLSNYLLPVYKMFKKYYLDVFLILMCFKITASTSLYEAFTIWDPSYFWRNYLIEIKRIYWFVYIYMIYIAIAGIWYIVGKFLINNDKKTNEIAYQ